MAVGDDHPPRTWRVTTRTALRALVTAAGLTALYFRLPFDRHVDWSTAAGLALGLLVVAGLMTWQVRAIVESAHPGLRALEALFVVVPLFILLFATAYYLMARSDPASFTSELSRVDALYFTVTVLSTVGFGDIAARTQTARLVVTVQMFLDLLLLGVGVRIILGAVQKGRQRALEAPAVGDATGP